MKKLICLLSLLSLLLCGCTQREEWSVDNYFLSDDGSTYSVSYRHEDGTEELIAEMGSYPQPLAIQSGHLYYVHGGSLVSVDLKDPEKRESLSESGLSGLSIGWMDEEAVYCPLLTDTEKCYRITLDLSDCQRITIPREQRPTDYDQLLEQICQAVGAIDDRIALRTVRARYSETGSLSSMELRLWVLQEQTYALNSWADFQVSITREGDGFDVSAQDQFRPLPMDSGTIAKMLSLQDFIKTLQAVDTSDLWSSQKSGQPQYYNLTYHAEEYEAAILAAGAEPICLNPDGTAAELPQTSLLVLAQCYQRGDSLIDFTDSKGLTVGSLRVILPLTAEK